MKPLFDRIPLVPHISSPPVHITTEKDFKGYYHWHQCCELLYIHQGQGKIMVNQRTYEIRGGMMFFFQPFQLHRVQAEVSKDTPYQRTIMYFDPLALESRLQAFSQISSFLQYHGKKN
jgi:hypothetical protein